MASIQFYTAERIFTGEQWLTNHAIVVQGGIISDVIPLSSLPSSVDVQHFADHFLAPAFIDIQIYGAYQKLLAVYPVPDSLSKLQQYCAAGGAAYCLPTVATNTNEVLLNCINAVREYWNNGGKGIYGLHLEGPWLNPVKRGAHVQSIIHSPTINEVKQLLDHGKGIIKMITLAPELCSREIIDYILANNIIISAGHSNATYQQANDGFAAGINAVTHLYNAMSALQHREPGLVGAAMDHLTAKASIIPDGHHVDYAAIRIAKAVMKERLFVITDAVTETTSGEYQHYLTGDKYEASGILSGSALTMNKALQNLVEHCKIDLAEALRMCSLYPAQVIHEEQQLGKIQKGYKANMVVMNNNMQVATLLTDY